MIRLPVPFALCLASQQGSPRPAPRPPGSLASVSALSGPRRALGGLRPSRRGATHARERIAQAAARTFPGRGAAASPAGLQTPRGPFFLPGAWDLLNPEPIIGEKEPDPSTWAALRHCQQRGEKENQRASSQPAGRQPKDGGIQSVRRN